MAVVLVGSRVSPMDLRDLLSNYFEYDKGISLKALSERYGIGWVANWRVGSLPSDPEDYLVDLYSSYADYVSDRWLILEEVDPEEEEDRWLRLPYTFRGSSEYVSKCIAKFKNLARWVREEDRMFLHLTFSPQSTEFNSPLTCLEAMKEGRNALLQYLRDKMCRCSGVDHKIEDCPNCYDLKVRCGNAGSRGHHIEDCPICHTKKVRCDMVDHKIEDCPNCKTEDSLDYVWVLEPTERGYPHYHLLVFAPHIPNIEDLAKWWEDHDFGKGLGVDWEGPYDSHRADKVSAYLTKYVSKTFGKMALGSEEEDKEPNRKLIIWSAMLWLSRSRSFAYSRSLTDIVNGTKFERLNNLSLWACSGKTYSSYLFVGTIQNGALEEVYQIFDGNFRDYFMALATPPPNPFGRWG